MDLPFNPAISFLRIYQNKRKSEYERNACTFMLIAALLTIGKLWDQPNYTSMDENTKKIQISSGVLLSSKGMKSWDFKQVDRIGEHYILNEISQTHKDNITFSPIYESLYSKTCHII